MTIVVGCDHAGFALKNIIAAHLKERGYEILDVGCYSEDPVDYPIYGKAVGEAVTSGKAEKGVAVCGSGIGISMAVNKVRGARCGLCTSMEMGRMTKEHNNANVIALGGRITEPELAIQIVDAWLDAEFVGRHHTKRIEMLDEM